MRAAMPPCRVRRAALRAERKRLGLHQLTGLPRVNRCHPELHGLPRKEYQKLYENLCQ